MPSSFTSGLCEPLRTVRGSGINWLCVPATPAPACPVEVGLPPPVSGQAGLSLRSSQNAECTMRANPFESQLERPPTLTKEFGIEVRCRGETGDGSCCRRCPRTASPASWPTTGRLVTSVPRSAPSSARRGCQDHQKRRQTGQDICSRDAVRNPRQRPPNANQGHLETTERQRRVLPSTEIHFGGRKLYTSPSSPRRTRLPERAVVHQATVSPAPRAGLHQAQLLSFPVEDRRLSGDSCVLDEEGRERGWSR
jgi:hypothetical protein